MGMRDILIFLGFILATLAVAFAGGLATAPGVRDWYPSLHKPAWTPPAWVFGPVWTVLYLCMAIAGFLAWRQSGAREAKWAMWLFAAQLTLNAAWSWVFFYLRQPGWGFVEIVVLWTAILVTTVAFFRISTWSGLLFVPYFLWVTFAACLNLAIWRLNAASAG